MKSLRLSIAMCTYNGSRYLREQLDSIACQGHLPDELVVCDDGSVDDTVQILSTFASQASFAVRVFVNTERLGPVRNFEKAIGLCQGDIIVLSDQDDIWESGKLARILEVLESHPGAMYAFSDAEMVDEGGNLLHHTLWQAVGLREKLAKFSGCGQLKMLLRKSLVTGAAMAFRSRFRELVLPIPSDWMHDSWIASLGSAVSCGVPIPESLLRYRRHSTQACGWRTKTFRQVFTRSLSAAPEESWSKVEQFRELSDRIRSAPSQFRPSPECLRLIAQKEKHLLQRAETRSAPSLFKVPKVLTELLSGRYQRFSESFWYSVIRDLY